MTHAMLIVFEPALFLLAALGWAAWEFWSMRTKKGAADSNDAFRNDRSKASSVIADDAERRSGTQE